MLTTYDVRWALRRAAPGLRRDRRRGRPGLHRGRPAARPRHRAHDRRGRALWWLVDRPNLFIKIPATRQGLPAITACLAEGISVNVTLIFSLERYGEVMDAFLTGLEQATGGGPRPVQIGSVASFFVSRVDTEVDQRLDKIGTPRRPALRGKAAIANARLAYQRTRRCSPRRGGRRWRRPGRIRSGRCGRRPASRTRRTTTPGTSIELVAPGVVNTMPEATLEAVADHGQIRGDTIRPYYGEAQQVLDRLAALGVDHGRQRPPRIPRSGRRSSSVRPPMPPRQPRSRATRRPRSTARSPRSPSRRSATRSPSGR